MKVEIVGATYPSGVTDDMAAVLGMKVIDVMRKEWPGLYDAFQRGDAGVFLNFNADGCREELKDCAIRIFSTGRALEVHIQKQAPPAPP